MKKKHFYLLMVFLFSLGWQMNAQSTCTQTFTGSGQDDADTTVTVNATDITCNGGGPINTITFNNSAGSLTSGYCGNWYEFTLTWDGPNAGSITGCGGDFDNTDVTGFTTLTVTSADLDAYSDSVTITFDLEIDYAPAACPPPTNLSAANITQNTADLSWTAGGNESSWNVEYGTAGFTPGQGQGTTVNVSQNPNTTITGLSPATSYDYYVQADCGSGQTSVWAGPYTFMTPGSCGFYTVSLIDSYGDGWNGGSLDVYVNGNLYDTYTLSGGAGPEDHLIPTNIGDILSFDYTAGSYSTENEYQVKDENGNVLVDEGANGATPGDIGDPAVPSGLTSCPACSPPASLSVSFVSNTETNLSWTETGSATQWNIEWGPAGFTQGQGNMVTGTNSNPYPLTGLTPRADYDFYVQADCGGSTSPWSGPYTWKQPEVGDDCGLPIMANVVQDCSQATPYTLDFSNAVSEYLSGCDGFGNYGYWLKINWPASGTLVINNTGTDVGLVILDACGGTELYCNNNSLGASTTLQSPSFSGAELWLYFWKDNQSGTADICLEEQTCPFPTNLATNNITSTSADLSWTENGSATTWDIEYGPAGFTQGQGTMLTGVTNNNPYNLTGLTQGTNYEWYVRADCGGGDTSAWAGPASFTTSCGIYTPDYTQDFSTFLPACWDENTGPVSGPTGTSGTSAWLDDGFANNGSTGSARINLYNTSHQDWLLSPHFDLSAGGYELKFDVAVTAYSTTSASDMGSDDEVQLLISTDGGSTWSNLMTWNVNNTPSNTGDPITVDLSSYTQSDVQFAFWASDGTVDDPEDYNFYVDNFVVRTAPTCPEPSALSASNITNNQAELSWTPGGNENMWNVEYGASGFTPGQGQGTTVNVSQNPTTTITGLSSATSYDYYVQADCGGGDSSNWVGPYTFNTLMDPVSNPSACGLSADIPDNGCGSGNYLIVPIQVTTAPGNLLGNGVKVSGVNVIIEHTFDADLEISLISPSGVEVLLSSDNGSSGNNYGDPNDCPISYTHFSMDAATSIANGSAPFIGDFVPEGNLADFEDGTSPLGLWKLKICDDAGADTGQLDYVEIEFAATNDEAADAIAIDVNAPDSGCQNPNIANNETATSSSPINNTLSCRGYRGGDVWFSFTAPALGKVKLIVGSSDWSTVAYALYDDPAGTSPMYCDGIVGTGSNILDGMTGGATYYLRMWDYLNNDKGNVEFCLENLPDVDECATAPTVNVDAAGSACESPTIADNTDATSSTSISGSPGCRGYRGGDVWYAFTAPADGQVNVVVSSSSWSTVAVAIYDNCTGSSPIDCNGVIGTGNVILGGMSGGATYYLRMWDYLNNDFGPVEFCLQEVGGAIRPSYQVGIPVSEEELNESQTEMNANEGLDMYVVDLDGNHIKVGLTTSDIMKELVVYDMMGRVIVQTQPNESVVTIPVNVVSGSVLFTKVTLDNGMVLTKKFLKK